MNAPHPASDTTSRLHRALYRAIVELRVAEKLLGDEGYVHAADDMAVAARGLVDVQDELMRVR